jgi:translation initiation factor eIF-2B subunit epsilon
MEAANETADPIDADPDAHFAREVAETFLRCAAEGHALDNVVLELNSLKLAEHRSFADVGRALAVAVIGLAGGPPPRTRPEYRRLYADGDGGAAGAGATKHDAATAARDLARRARAHVAAWAPLLSRFARDEDDQVEVLLTLEEWCAGDGGVGAGGGRAFAPLFAELLKTLYDADVVEEGALLAWADEKAGASPEERVFLERAAPLIRWLREAESEEGSE